MRLIALYSFVPLGYALFGTRGAVAAIPAAALVNTGILLIAQGHMGLLDIRRELAALPLFGVGMLAGWVLRLALA